MRRSIRKASVACGAAFASAAVALTTATGAGAVTTAVAIGGLGTPDMHEVVISPLLGGKLARENDILDGVEWPAQANSPGTGKLTLGQSIKVGITNLGTHFDDAYARLAPGEQFTVVGFSAGSLVVNDFMRVLAADPDAPGKDQVKFILVADSSRQKLIEGGSKYNPKYDYTYQPAPETAYDIDVVTGEYDGAADMPDRWWNFLAVMNAIAGGIYVHVPMMFSDYAAVTPDENITVVTNSKGGVTTTYLVPTKTLPIVQLLPFLKPREAELKAKIDAAYSRNDDRTTTTSVARSFAATADVQDSVEQASSTVETPEVEDASETTVDADEGPAPTKSRGASTAVDADTDEVSSTDDSEESSAADDEADAADADDAKADADAAKDADDASDATESTDSTKSKDSTDSGSSADASSDGSGSSDSGSSE